MAETLESIKQEIAKIAAEKADLKGIVDQQKATIERQETTIGNLQEALKAADANMIDRVNKLQKEIDEYKEDVRKLTELKEDLKEDLEASKAAHKRTWEEKENFREKNLELKQQVALLESIDAEDHHEDVIELNDEVARLNDEVARLNKLLDTAYVGIANRDEEIDELRQDILDMTDKNQASKGMVAALAAKDEELRKLGEKVPAKDREINDLKEQVKSLEKALDRKGDESYKLSLEKEHLVNAIENAYRSLMITRGYQLPGESGVSNG